MTCCFCKLGSSLNSQVGGEFQETYKFLVQLVLLCVDFISGGRHLAVWSVDVILYDSVVKNRQLAEVGKSKVGEEGEKEEADRYYIVVVL